MGVDGMKGFSVESSLCKLYIGHLRATKGPFTYPFGRSNGLIVQYGPTIPNNK